MPDIPIPLATEPTTLLILAQLQALNVALQTLISTQAAQNALIVQWESTGATTAGSPQEP